MLTLCMIVKNEAAVLARCLESVRPLLSAWLLVDTGSSDGTQELAREKLAGLPGQLLERPWVDFAHNRTEALAAAAPAGLLFLDADMTVRGRPEPLHGDGQNRTAKFLRDREILRRADPNDPRNVFYLAQTEACLALDQAPAALLEAWERRPWRSQPLYDLARHYRLHHRDQLARLFADDVLFVHREVSIARSRTGELAAARQAHQELLARELPGPVHDCVLSNDRWCASHRKG